MRLSSIGEFSVIRQIQESFNTRTNDIILGIGDDAAIIKTSGKNLLVTVDMLIEGIHFSIDTTTPFQLGYKSLAVNISDIYAMGGTPRFFLLGLGLPGDYMKEDLDSLLAGMDMLAREKGISLIGGDTCESKEGVIISGTLIGEVQRALRRCNARIGDGIFVTGTLGDSALGLRILEKLGRHVRVEHGKGAVISGKRFFSSIKRHLMPEPRDPSAYIAVATSMIDISDGLLIDLSHICDESHVGYRLYLDKIPLSDEVMEWEGISGRDAVELALSGGEDYELLFTAPMDSKVDATIIGEITQGGRVAIDKYGMERFFEAEGYEHFKPHTRKQRTAGYRNRDRR